MMVRVSVLSSSSMRRRCFLSEGRKASKQKRLVGRPERVRAVMQAAGPGRLLTLIPYSMHIATRVSPGSEIQGVPASVIRAMFCPSRILAIRVFALSYLLYS